MPAFSNARVKTILNLSSNPLISRLMIKDSYTSSYSASGVKIGTYGVIGPLRMDYQKVVSVLEGVGKILEDMINEKK